ncbi:MAG: hypothetical protein JWR56_2326 [Massilia sp.]|nr:hypothetical protein [Massilia sp.]
MSTLSRWPLPIITFVLMLSGCGGGGAAPAPLASPTPVNSPVPTVTGIDVAAAWSNYVGVPHSWTMRGQDSDARTHEMTVEMKPGDSAAFPMTGSTGKTVVQSIRFAADGADTVSTVGTLFFTPQTVIGMATADHACEPARGAMSALPSAGAVGDSGPMFVLEGYAGCSIAGQKLRTTTYKWSVEADANLTMFCITSRQQDGDGAYIGTETNCMEAASNGTLGNKAKFTTTRPDGSSISGKNY